MKDLFIHNRRIELGLTLEDVAKAVGVSASCVQRWESGDISNMRRDRIVRLAKVLNVSPLEIIGVDTSGDIALFSEERELILAYRQQPEAVQDVIKKMLDIESGGKGSAISVS